MMRKIYFWIKVPSMIFGISLFPIQAMAVNSTQITYQGSLIALPCTIEPGEENQVVEMGEITAQALYRYTRTEGKTLYFYLKDCDPTIDNHINISISGATNEDGLLAFSGNSEASGAGIGIEYLDGTPIVINSPDSLRVQVNKGDMTLRSKAYLKIESSAQQNRNLVAGRYNAILTYTFKYE